ncbi:MAG TPA: lysophospholipid acyltransferase family protein [Anaerolineales bacterium]|nr:lysophospholipid acyltransferase family protein [Anaerolineales bacterium]
MNNASYFLIVRMVARVAWRGRLLGVENLPSEGPAVFVANHLGPQGPISAVCAIPLRFYPWIVAEMVDKRLAPEFLKMDFVEPSLGLGSPVSLAFAKALSLITVPMLRALGCIPVNREDYKDSQEALQASLSLLTKGGTVLIYPEDPERGQNPQTKMSPFYKGFTRLGELFYAETGERLSFYPVAIHESRDVMVGAPILYIPHNPRGLERHRLKDQLEEAIKEMYLGMEAIGSSA